MRSCMEQEMGLLLEQEVVESQRGVLINEDEPGNERQPTVSLKSGLRSHYIIGVKLENGERN